MGKRQQKDPSKLKMVSYWNHFDSISFADLKESDIQNKILV